MCLDNFVVENSRGSPIRLSDRLGKRLRVNFELDLFLPIDSGESFLLLLSGKKNTKTYNTRDSLVVTDPTTSLALTGLSMGERTGSRVLQWVWSYVLGVVRSGSF